MKNKFSEDVLIKTSRPTGWPQSSATPNHFQLFRTEIMWSLKKTNHTTWSYWSSLNIKLILTQSGLNDVV